jgi:hypothetical protein
MTLKRRIAAAERAVLPAAPQLIRVRGGPDYDKPTHATVGGQELRRRPDETLAAFEARALMAAKAAGEKFVVVGGLAS